MTDTPADRGDGHADHSAEADMHPAHAHPGASHSQDAEPEGTDPHAVVYRCPMDCEDGKQYGKPVACSVCNIDTIAFEPGE